MGTCINITLVLYTLSYQLKKLLGYLEKYTCKFEEKQPENISNKVTGISRDLFTNVNLEYMYM